MMNFLIFASDRIQKERLLQSLGLSCRHEHVEVIVDTAALKRRLRRSQAGIQLLVLSIADLRELECIIGMADLLDDHRLILVLPDRSRQTVALAHTLYPRFISYTDVDCEELRAVIVQMLAYTATTQVRCFNA